MKKSQISSQIFVYIMAVLIVGLILIIGYRAILTIINTGKQIPLEDFTSDFQNKVNIVSRQYNTRESFEFSLPERFDQVCFIDSMEDGEFNNGLSTNPNIDPYPLIKNKIQSNVQENIFLLNNGIIEYERPLYVEDLDVEDDFICLENKGEIEIWLQGTGRKALLYVKSGWTKPNSTLLCST